MLGHPGSFRLVQCRRCGLIYQNPRPVDMAPYYAGSYLPFEHRPQRQPLEHRQTTPETVAVGAAGGYYQLMRQATKRTSGRLLDVGCATGDFLVVMAAAGWEVAGCDFSTRAVEQARRRVAPYQTPHVVHGSLEAAAFPDEAFDIVTLWHSIEHLPDPLGTLQEVQRILRPDGLLVIQTPAWLSLESQLWKGYWSGLDLPRHLYVFSPQTLAATLVRAGFAIERMLPETSYYFWLVSLLFLAQRWVSPHLLGWLYRVLRRGPAVAYFKPFFRVIDQSGQGSLLTVVARKRAS
jgi:2-polyprenyl-3-methyl-5-hydroxy-6-metoxy-1,4-benzoquinol methylase